MENNVGPVLKLILVILGLALAVAIEPVYAGGGDGSGGGIVWKCSNGNPKSVYLADVAQEEMNDSTKYLFPVLENEGFHYVENVLNITNYGLGDQVRERLGQLKFHGTHAKLELLNDDKLPLETTIQGRHCMKAQLAIQNFKTGIVTYNIELYNELGLAERVLFIVHETLVSLQERHFGNTVPIRDELFWSASENMSNIMVRVGRFTLSCKGRCFQLADPLEGEADLLSADVPTDAQVVAAHPGFIDTPSYLCERSPSSYLLCGQGPGSCNYFGGFVCRPKPGIKIRVNGVETAPGPDGTFYVPEDQLDKVEGRTEPTGSIAN